jgi:hypothetical protein
MIILSSLQASAARSTIRNHRRGKDIKFVFCTWLLEGPPQIDWNVRLPLERARFRVHIENRVLVSVTENRPIA